jgi:hypothetical protein
VASKSIDAPTHFHSLEERDMVQLVPESSEEDEVEAAQAELAGGRQAINEEGPDGRKRKLERAFMDRGVLPSVGVLLSDDHFSSAIVSDLLCTAHGWPPLFSKLV